MNFIEYCLYTKNFSALKACRCYTEIKKKNGNTTLGALAGATVVGAPLGYMLYNKSNELNTLRNIHNDDTKASKQYEDNLNKQIAEQQEQIKELENANKNPHNNDQPLNNPYNKILHVDNAQDKDDYLDQHHNWHGTIDDGTGGYYIVLN